MITKNRWLSKSLYLIITVFGLTSLSWAQTPATLAAAIKVKSVSISEPQSPKTVEVGDTVTFKVEMHDTSTEPKTYTFSVPTGYDPAGVVAPPQLALNIPGASATLRRASNSDLYFTYTVREGDLVNALNVADPAKEDTFVGDWSIIRASSGVGSFALNSQAPEKLTAAPTGLTKITVTGYTMTVGDEGDRNFGALYAGLAPITVSTKSAISGYPGLSTFAIWAEDNTGTALTTVKFCSIGANPKLVEKLSFNSPQNGVIVNNRYMVSAEKSLIGNQIYICFGDSASGVYQRKEFTVVANPLANEDTFFSIGGEADVLTTPGTTAGTVQYQSKIETGIRTTKTINYIAEYDDSLVGSLYILADCVTENDASATKSVCNWSGIVKLSPSANPDGTPLELTGRSLGVTYIKAYLPSYTADAPAFVPQYTQVTVQQETRTISLDFDGAETNRVVVEGYNAVSADGRLISYSPKQVLITIDKASSKSQRFLVYPVDLNGNPFTADQISTASRIVTFSGNNQTQAAGIAAYYEATIPANATSSAGFYLRGIDDTLLRSNNVLYPGEVIRYRAARITDATGEGITKVTLVEADGATPEKSYNVVTSDEMTPFDIFVNNTDPVVMSFPTSAGTYSVGDNVNFAFGFADSSFDWLKATMNFGDNSTSTIYFGAGDPTDVPIDATTWTDTTSARDSVRTSYTFEHSYTTKANNMTWSLTLEDQDGGSTTVTGTISIIDSMNVTVYPFNGVEGTDIGWGYGYATINDAVGVAPIGNNRAYSSFPLQYPSSAHLMAFPYNSGATATPVLGAATVSPSRDSFFYSWDDIGAYVWPEKTKYTSAVELPIQQIQIALGGAADNKNAWLDFSLRAHYSRELYPDDFHGTARSAYTSIGDYNQDGIPDGWYLQQYGNNIATRTTYIEGASQAGIPSGGVYPGLGWIDGQMNSTVKGNFNFNNDNGGKNFSADGGNMTMLQKLRGRDRFLNAAYNNQWISIPGWVVRMGDNNIKLATHDHAEDGVATVGFTATRRIPYMVGTQVGTTQIYSVARDTVENDAPAFDKPAAAVDGLFVNIETEEFFTNNAGTDPFFAYGQYLDEPFSVGSSPLEYNWRTRYNTSDDADSDGITDATEYWFWYYASRIVYAPVDANNNIISGLWPAIDYTRGPHEGPAFSLGRRYNPAYDPDNGTELDGTALTIPLPAIDVLRYFDPYSKCPTSGPLLDLDRDGISNLEELAIGTNPLHADTDGDGMPDGWEVAFGLNPLSTISQQGADGNPDRDAWAVADIIDENGEVQRLTSFDVYKHFGFNPWTAWIPDGAAITAIMDHPKGGLYAGALATYNTLAFTNIDEFQEAVRKHRGSDIGGIISVSTSPTKADTDGDGTPDGWELYVGSDPRSDLPGKQPDSVKVDDGDDLSHADEFTSVLTLLVYPELKGSGFCDFWKNKLTPTDPNNRDTDFDGVDDGDEGGTLVKSSCPVNYCYNPRDNFFIGGGLNPAAMDTDSDGIPDGWEFKYGRDGGNAGLGLDPTDPTDYDYDNDGDGLTNYQEYLTQGLRHLRYDLGPDQARIYKDNFETGDIYSMLKDMGNPSIGTSRLDGTTEGFPLNQEYARQVAISLEREGRISPTSVESAFILAAWEDKFSGTIAYTDTNVMQAQRQFDIALANWRESINDTILTDNVKSRMTAVDNAITAQRQLLGEDVRNFRVNVKTFVDAITANDPDRPLEIGVAPRWTAYYTNKDFENNPDVTANPEDKTAGLDLINAINTAVGNISTAVAQFKTTVDAIFEDPFELSDIDDVRGLLANIATAHQTMNETIEVNNLTVQAAVANAVADTSPLFGEIKGDIRDLPFATITTAITTFQARLQEFDDQVSDVALLLEMNLLDLDDEIEKRRETLEIATMALLQPWTTVDEFIARMNTRTLAGLAFDRATNVRTVRTIDDNPYNTDHFNLWEARKTAVTAEMDNAATAITEGENGPAAAAIRTAQIAYETAVRNSADPVIGEMYRSAIRGYNGGIWTQLADWDVPHATRPEEKAMKGQVFPPMAQTIPYFAPIGLHSILKPFSVRSADDARGMPILGGVLNPSPVLINAYSKTPNFSNFITTNPNTYDSDSDGMDDFWEIFHGLNPVLGDYQNAGDGDSTLEGPEGSYGAYYYATSADPVSYAYLGIGGNNGCFGSVSPSGNNPFGNPPNTGSNVQGYNYYLYPWLAGTPWADPDGDGLINAEEAVNPNGAGAVNYGTDPSPLWFTDWRNPNSFTARFYALLNLNIAKEKTTGTTPAVNRDRFSSELAMNYIYSIGNASPSITFSSPFSFEVNEGWDTDGDGFGDKDELVISALNGNPQSGETPLRRQVMYFDGQGALQTPTLFKIGPNAMRTFTVELWVKPNALTDADVAGSQQVLVDRPWTFDDLAADPAQVRHNFQIGLKVLENAKGDKILVPYGMYTGAGTYLEKSPVVTGGNSNALPTDSWTHIAFVVASNGTTDQLSSTTANTLTLYINGSAVASSESSLIPATGVISQVVDNGEPASMNTYTYRTAPLLIGATPNRNWVGAIANMTDGTIDQVYQNFYKGFLDEVRIWNGARTETQIKSKYSSTMTYNDVITNRTEIFTERYDGSGHYEVLNNAELIAHYSFNNLPSSSPNNVDDILNVYPGKAQHTDEAADVSTGGFKMRQLSYTFNGDELGSLDPDMFQQTVIAPDATVTFGRLPALSELFTSFYNDFNVNLKSQKYTDEEYVPWIHNTVQHAPKMNIAVATRDNTTKNIATATNHTSIIDIRFNSLTSMLRPMDSVYWSVSRAGDTPTFAPFSMNVAADPYSAISYRAKAEFDVNTYRQLSPYTQRIGSDLLPLGGAFVKYTTSLWDSAGPATDPDIKDIKPEDDPNLFTENGDSKWFNEHPLYPGSTYGQIWLRDNVAKGQTLDSDGDGLPDWWETFYGLDPLDPNGANGPFGDPDGDGLYNYAEYVAGANPKAYSTLGNGLSDFHVSKWNIRKFPTQGFYYTDSDFMEAFWEHAVGLDVDMNDANRDPDQDGWSNWAEARANTFGFTHSTNPYSRSTPLMNGVQVEYPEPPMFVSFDYVGSKLTGTGTNSFTGATIIMQSYRNENMDGEPDAIYEIALSSAAVEHELLVGTYRPGTISGYLEPGNINPGSLQFFNTRYVPADTGSTETGVEVGTSWSMRDNTRGEIIQLRQYTDGTNTVTREHIIGTVDYKTGKYSMVLEDLVYASTGSEVSGTLLNAKFTSTLTSAQLPATFTLVRPTSGNLREGKNYIMAFIDLDGNNEFSSGEPMGIVDGGSVDVGWDVVRDVHLTLTDEPPSGSMRVIIPDSVFEATYTPDENESVSTDGSTTTPTGGTVTRIPASAKNAYVYIVNENMNIVYKRAIPVNKRFISEHDFLNNSASGLTGSGLNDVYRGYIFEKEVVSFTNVEPFATITNKMVNINAGVAKVVNTTDMSRLYNSTPVFTWQSNIQPLYAEITLTKGNAQVYTEKVRAPGPKTQIDDASSGLTLHSYEYKPAVRFGDFSSTGVYLGDGAYSYTLTLQGASNSKKTFTGTLNVDMLNSKKKYTAYANYNTAYRKFRVKYNGAVYSKGDLAKARIRLFAYDNAAFAGNPIAKAGDYASTEAAVAGINEWVSATNVVTTATSEADGIPETSLTQYDIELMGLKGTEEDFYAMAFLDLNADGIRQPFEPWGYAMQGAASQTGFYFDALPIKAVRSGTEDIIEFYIQDIDSDNDKLSDAWEWSSAGGAEGFLNRFTGTPGEQESEGGNILIPSTDNAIGDSDGDGVSDKEEQDNGTDPNSAVRADGLTDRLAIQMFHSQAGFDHKLKITSILNDSNEEGVDLGFGWFSTDKNGNIFEATTPFGKKYAYTILRKSTLGDAWETDKDTFNTESSAGTFSGVSRPTVKQDTGFYKIEFDVNQK